MVDKREPTKRDATRVPRAVVVGAGHAGLSAAIKLVELGIAVDLISLAPARRAHSTCDASGVNAALDTARQGDSPRAHFEDAVTAGAFLAQQPPLRAMTEAAPRLVGMLDRVGVPFRRNAEGRLDLVRQPASRFRRTALSGASTGLHVTAALDQQLARLEALDVRDGKDLTRKGEPMVRRFEGWDFVATVRDDAGTCVGVVAQDLTTMAMRSFPADGVIVATGGAGALFSVTTAGTSSTGSAAARLFREGVVYANPELFQIDPVSIAVGEKWRAVPSLLRSWGAKLFVPRGAGADKPALELSERERDAFAERLADPGVIATDDLVLAALVERARSTRGDDSDPIRPWAYLDASAAGREGRVELDGFFTSVERATQRRLESPPFKVEPAIQCALGGLWVDFESDADHRLVIDSPRNQATSVPGLYAAGEVEYQLSGAQMAPGDAVVAAIFAGELAATGVAAYRAAMTRSALDLPRSTFERTEKRETELYVELFEEEADTSEVENAYQMHRDLARAMSTGASFDRGAAGLKELSHLLEDSHERFSRVRTTDTSRTMNRGVPFMRHLDGMILLARAVVAGAMAREESRGHHLRSDFEDRDDERFLRTTLVRAVSTMGSERPHRGVTPPHGIELIESFSYACVGKSITVDGSIDVSLLVPRRAPRVESQDHARGADSERPASDPDGPNPEETDADSSS